MSLNIKAYSVRQLSPFVGNIQIIEADFCRALSSDGEQWQIQASCETHQQKWKISEASYTPRRYVLYGSWNKSQGLSTLPLDPMLDVPSLQHVSETLVQHLNNEPELPFPQSDHFECWSLNASNQPLALLASASEQQMIPHIQLPDWQAIPQQDMDRKRPEELQANNIQLLEAYYKINTRNTQWFNREDITQPLKGKSVNTSITSFPELLINTEILPENLQSIAIKLQQWQSPRLLGLYNLTAETRQQLEQEAQHHATETAKRLAIYPQPVSEKIHNKIMVELKIRGQ